MNITSMLPDEINENFKLSPSFRGKQIFKAIHQGVSNISEISTISKDLRDKLNKTTQIFSTSIEEEHIDEDGTSKLKIKLCDGYYIETPFLIHSKNRTATHRR